jgi:hypothetical protein
MGVRVGSGHCGSCHFVLRVLVLVSQRRDGWGQYGG